MSMFGDKYGLGLISVLTPAFMTFQRSVKCLLTILISIYVSFDLKLLIRYPRPNHMSDDFTAIACGPDSGFPSAHSLINCAAYYSLTYLILEQFRI